MSSRREARERTMQALYAFEVGGGDAVDIIKLLIEDQLKRDKDKETIAFARRLFLRSLDMRKEADEIVEQYTRNWELSRIALIDRIVLRMSICELLTFEDIPPKVTMNEAIDIAKRYSTAKSGKFVNGILDSILSDFKRDGKLNKSGRGLVGMGKDEKEKSA